MACGRWGHVFATSANPRSCKTNVHMSPSFTVRGGEYDTKMCHKRIDDASSICEGENFRRLGSTRERPKLEKQDRSSLEASSNGILDYRNTSRDVSPYRPHVVPLPFPLLGLCLKVVPLLLLTGSSIIRVRFVAFGMCFKRRTFIPRPNSTPFS